MSLKIMNRVLLIGMFIAIASTKFGESFYYQQQYHQLASSPILYSAESSPYAIISPRTISGEYAQIPTYATSASEPAILFDVSASNLNSRMFQPSSSSSSDDNMCQGGFVEHCLVQANQDGEQSMLESNQTSMAADRSDLSKEFDGMCQVVIRFIDCINLHHSRCNPTQKQLLQTDVFYQSWTKMCSNNSKIRNKYLQHAKCIKHALSQNNGQEQCQSLFQSYFLTQQFSMDSIEETVQYGCCAFNEWQYCIDSLIQRQCGPDATKAIQDLIDQASGGLVSSLCEKKLFGRKSKACLGKKNFNYNKLQSLDPRMNATLQKYISIFGDFIERLPDDDDDDQDQQPQQRRRR